MSVSEIARLLGSWEGNRVGAAQRFEAGVKGPLAEAGIELFRSSDGGCVAAESSPYGASQKDSSRTPPGILAHCRHRLHTSLLEGINNNIKAIKRMGLRLSGRHLLLPQNQVSFSRNSGMNLIFRTRH